MHPSILAFSTHKSRTRTRKRRNIRILDLHTPTERESWSPNHQERKRFLLHPLEKEIGRREYKNTHSNRKTNMTPLESRDFTPAGLEHCKTNEA